MSMSTSRITFTKALTIAQYNWPFYAAAGVLFIGGLVVSTLTAFPMIIRGLALLGALNAIWFAGASFLAAHWVFDRSELTQWHWLAREFDAAPIRWVHITAGLEETSAPLNTIFPGTEGKVLDIYDPQTMSEPAIARARQMKGSASGTAAQPNDLPVEKGWADAVFLLMTAHELRRPKERELFFKELARILSPKGRVIVVEHLQDLPNALAFGPGVFHFFPRQEWLRLGSVAGLTVEHESSFTPFVRVFVYRHAASQID